MDVGDLRLRFMTTNTICNNTQSHALAPRSQDNDDYLFFISCLAMHKFVVVDVVVVAVSGKNATGGNFQSTQSATVSSAMFLMTQTLQS